MSQQDFRIAGIGPKVTERLNRQGIRTISEAERYIDREGVCGLLQVLQIGPGRSRLVLRRLKNGQACPQCHAAINSTTLNHSYDALLADKECPLMRKYNSGGLPKLKPGEAPVPLEGAAPPVFGYQGGKFRQRKMIIGQMPPHVTYVEPFCLAPDTLVWKRAKGMVPISSIKVDDFVWGTDSWVKVLETMNRPYADKMVALGERGDYRKLVTTKDHPILAVPSESLSRGGKFKLTVFFGRRLAGRAKFIQAGKLEKGDLIVRHFPSDSTNASRIRMPHWDGERQRSRPKYLNINSETARLVGLYLAEGYCDRGTVGFVFHENETTYHNFVKTQMMEHFDVRGSIMKRDGNRSIILRFNSIQATKFFSQFGNGAHQKSLSPLLLQLPIRQRQRELLRGAWNGDGTSDDDGVSYTTVSPMLACGIHYLMLRQGMMPTIRETEINTALPNGSEYRGIGYQVNLYSQGMTKMRNIVQEEHIKGTLHHNHIAGINLFGLGSRTGERINAILSYVDSVEEVESSGYVFNLRVEGGAFATMVGTVHNCGAANVMLAKPPAPGKEVLNDADPGIMKIHQRVKSKGGEFDFSPNKKKWLAILAKPRSARSAEEQAYLIEHAYGNKNADKRMNYFEHGKKSGSYDLGKAHARMADAVMLNKDFAKVMQMFNSPDQLTYLDPPYDKEDSKTYTHGGDKESRVTPERVAEAANKMKGKVMVSYDNSPDVRKAFSDSKWRIQKYDVHRSIAGTGMAKKATPELLITNFDPEKVRKDAPEYVQTQIAEGMKAMFG